jgi:hypothetical protein
MGQAGLITEQRVECSQCQAHIGRRRTLRPAHCLVCGGSTPGTGS